MVKETKEGLKILIGVGGQESLFINSKRLSECIKYLYSNNLRYITINSFQDYKAKDIDFLIQLKDFIYGLSVMEQHYNYKVVNELHNLRYISIPDNGKDVIDLENFPNIENCGVWFFKRLLGLESCNKLKGLSLSNYKSKTKNFSLLPTLDSLEQLEVIKTDAFNLMGLERFTNLKKLEIYGASMLESIAGLQGLTNLKEIQLENCKKIVDFEILGKL